MALEAIITYGIIVGVGVIIFAALCGAAIGWYVMNKDRWPRG